MCPNCHAPTRAEDAFCTSCGTALRLWPVGQTPPGGQAPPEGMAVGQRHGDVGQRYGQPEFSGQPSPYGQPALPYGPPDPKGQQPPPYGQQSPRFDQPSPSGQSPSGQPSAYGPPGPWYDQHGYGFDQQPAAQQMARPPTRWPGSSPSDPRPRPPQFRLDLKRLAPAELIAGGATVVFLIGFFMPWFGSGTIGASQNGLSAHGYLALALISAVTLLAYLLLRAGWDTLPFALPVTQVQVLLFGAGLQLLLVLPGFLFKPSGFGWGFGSYLSLFCAMIACGAAAWPAIVSLRQTGHPHPRP